MKRTRGPLISSSRDGDREELGPYRLVSVLHHADFGSLWASVVTSGDRAGETVAVRRIRPTSPDTSSVIESLAANCKPMIGVVVDRVVPTCDVVVLPDRVGIVTGYVEGEILRSLQTLATLRRKPMPLPVALRIAIDILDGEFGLHSLAKARPEIAKRVFGGINPATIVVGSNGEASLVDVAIASAATRLPALAKGPTTMAYRAPEHVEQEGDIGPWTDVFLTGIVLWELVAGRTLFPQGTAMAGGDANDKMRDSKPSSSGLVSGLQPLEIEIPRLDNPAVCGEVSVPKALAKVVERALDRNIGARFQTAEEMSDALSKAAGRLAAPRADVAAYVKVLVASIVETRREAIERARDSIQPPVRTQSRLERPRGAQESPVAPQGGHIATAAQPLPPSSTPEAGALHPGQPRASREVGREETPPKPATDGREPAVQGEPTEQRAGASDAVPAPLSAVGSQHQPRQQPEPPPSVFSPTISAEARSDDTGCHQECRAVVASAPAMPTAQSPPLHDRSESTEDESPAPALRKEPSRAVIAIAAGVASLLVLVALLAAASVVSKGPEDADAPSEHDASQPSARAAGTLEPARMASGSVPLVIDAESPQVDATEPSSSDASIDAGQPPPNRDRPTRVPRFPRPPQPARRFDPSGI